jgi:hypothetical protein
MNKECERTRNALPDYLLGHVFRTTRSRIDRHLRTCVVCRSEFEALKRMEETRQILKYVDSPDGVAHRVKEGVFALAKLKKVLYRPLWLAVIVLVGIGLYYYAMLPRQLDLEIESIVKTVPATTTSTTSVPAAEPIQEASVVTKQVASVQGPAPRPVSTQAMAPLAVSILLVDETASIQRVNEVMNGHEELRRMKFSDSKRQLSGALTAQELLTFFDRMGEVAKVRYDRQHFKSFPAGQQIPFVLTLKAAPRSVEKPKPASHPAPGAETHIPAETAAPVPLVTTPATSAAQ